jgi:hypothetical protein
LTCVAAYQVLGLPSALPVQSSKCMDPGKLVEPAAYSQEAWNWTPRCSPCAVMQ